MTEKRNNYPLTERTAIFSKNIIKLCKSIKIDLISRPIIDQLIRAGTSIGANYMEANNASSRKDFRNKIYICKKEAQESKYWLALAQEISGDELINKLSQEAQELTMIFQKIVSTIDK